MIKYGKLASVRPRVRTSVFNISSRIFRYFPIIIDLLEHKMESKNAIEYFAQ